MTASARAVARLVGIKSIVAALAVAMFCAMGPTSNVLHCNVVETASIQELPTTIGSADSDLYNRTQADVDRTLDTLQAMGVQNVRIIVPWAGVQPLNAPLYNWANVDRMVNGAEKRGMGVLAVLNSTPAWAADRYLSGHPTPEAFAEFAGLVANRYRGKIAAYEVWNEPNGIIFWNPVDPEAYTYLLQAGYTAIKDEDPDALVIGAVVASLFSAREVTMNPQDFVAGMYAHGAKGYFDALSFHPYHYLLEFSESGRHPAGALNQLEQMRQLMIDNGDGDLKIWASEYGLPTTQIATGEVITEEHQARFIEDFLRTWRETEGTGPVFIYSTRDTLSGDPDPQKNFGFFYTDWTPKQAAYVLAQLAGGLPPTEPDRPILDAIAAVARAIADATVWLINAGIRVIGGLIDLGVRFVRGLADATVAVISAVVDAVERVIDRIGDRLDPEGAEPFVAEATEPEVADDPGAGARTTAAVFEPAPATPSDDVDALEDETGTDDQTIATAGDPAPVFDEDQGTDGPDTTDDPSTLITNEDTTADDAVEPDAVEPDDQADQQSGDAAPSDGDDSEGDANAAA